MIPVMGRMWMPLMSYGRSDLNIARTAKGSLVLTGHAPSIFVPYTAATGLGELTISGYAPTAGVNTPISAGVGALTITGHAPSVDATDIILLVRFNETTGSHDITDDSIYNETALVDTSQYTVASSPNVFGTNVGSFTTGSGSSPFYTNFPASDQYSMGTGAWTIEGYFYANSTTGTKGIVACRLPGATSTDGWSLLINGSTVQFFELYTGSVSGQTIGTISSTTWYFYAITRSSNTVRGYLGKVSDGTADKLLEYTTSHTFGSTTLPMVLGCNSTSGQWMQGYMESIRITRGTARYTGSSLTIPSSEF